MLGASEVWEVASVSVTLAVGTQELGVGRHTLIFPRDSAHCYLNMKN